MTLLHSIANFVSGFWSNDLEPWLKNFLGNVVHAEAALAVSTAEAYVTQALPALASAAATGDFSSFADSQASIVKATAQDLLANGEKVGITAVTTAVTALIAGHPDVIAAQAASVQPNGTNGAAPASH